MSMTTLEKANALFRLQRPPFRSIAAVEKKFNLPEHSLRNYRSNLRRAKRRQRK